MHLMRVTLPRPTLATSLVRAAEQPAKEPTLGLCGTWSRQQTDHSGLGLSSFLVRSVEPMAEIIDRSLPVA